MTLTRDEVPGISPFWLVKKRNQTNNFMKSLFNGRTSLSKEAITRRYVLSRTRCSGGLLSESRLRGSATPSAYYNGEMGTRKVWAYTPKRVSNEASIPLH